MLKYIALVCITVGAALYAQEKSIVIVIPSYNNAQWYKANLDSVCFQRYNNYRIIYIDDCSTDNTARLVKTYINEHHLHDKVTLLCNQRRKGAMANHYLAAWTCNDDEIIVHVDGDDWLKDNNVLKKINAAYQDPFVWLTYGQFERYPSRKVGFCKTMPPAIIKGNMFREYDWITSHVRTFYAGLFKQIRLHDLLYEGDFFDVTCDLAMMMPLLELAGTHIRNIEDILYVYNEATTGNDYKTKLLRQLHCDRVIRSRKKYQPVTDYHPIAEQPIIDVLIFFTGSSQCKQLIEELMQTSEVGVHIMVVYKNKYLFHQSRLEQLFPGVVFKQIADDISVVLDELLRTSGYLLCLYDTVYSMQPLLLHEAIKALEQTQALAVHVTLGQDIKQAKGLLREQQVPPLIEVMPNIYAWQYKYAEFDWKVPYGVGCLYPKKAIKKLLKGASFKTLDEYMYVLQSHMMDYDQVGLCYGYAPLQIDC